MAVLAATLFLITAAPAQAGFFPDLAVGLSPAAVKESPVLTATISQPGSDTAIKTFTLSLPPGFTAAEASGAAGCSATLLAANSCPADSYIGNFNARLATGASLAGAISKTGDDTFGMYVSVLGGAITQVVHGSVIQRENGTVDLKFDELPALRITTLALRFWGGDTGLFSTPARCGDYTLDGKFTSQREEFAIDRTQISIAGCDGAPAIQVENVRLSDRRFKAGGSPYTGRTIIAWWLPEVVHTTRLLIYRRVNGKWRKQGALVGTGNAGDNVLRWDGRLRGDELKPGRYGVRIKPAGSGPSERVGFRILR